MSHLTVFVTGGTGYIGSAVVRELANAGHRVLALTRLAERSAYLDRLGVAETVVGDVRDESAWRDAALEADVLVHVAAEDSDARAEADRAAVESLVDIGRAGRPRSLVYTSGCFILGETGDEPVGEDASVEGAPALVDWRPAHERQVLEAEGEGLTTTVIRPGMVYGGKDGAFADFFASAESEGAARFVGDGTNHWSPVYRGDVARLYRAVVERGGSGIFHCAERAARVGDLAVAASQAAGAGGATERWRVEDARESMGAFADALTMNQVLGCPRARAFGWEPVHPPFTESAKAVYREWKE